MRIVEIMSTPVRTVAPTDTATSAWKLLQLHKIRHLVVVHGGRVVGVVSDGDMGGRHGELVRSGRTVADLMTDRVVTIAPDARLREAANLMRGHSMHCLPVLDEDKLVGIVTTRDLLELLGRGTERPETLSRRAVLKSRANQPHAQTASKASGRARSRTAR